MAHGYPYPCHRRTGHTKLYEIRCKETHALLYIGVTDYSVRRRCSGNPAFKADSMYCQEVGRFDSRKEAEEVEAILLEVYDPPLNTSYGYGQTGVKQSPEVVRKRVQAMEWYSHNDETKRKIGESNGYRVRCVETGDEFYSMAEAARWCGGTDSKISQVTRGIRKTHKGYHWVLV